nr:MAG TPA: hypothetical protein [Caudoviricetes sp.]DAQ60581.1 MAG TPA: hypothetical protein [Bacteriophage sp.]
MSLNYVSYSRSPVSGSRTNLPFSIRLKKSLALNATLSFLLIDNYITSQVLSALSPISLD